MEVVVYPDKVADTSMERLLDVLFNSDVMIYVADAENLNSTDKVSVYVSYPILPLPYGEPVHPREAKLLSAEAVF